MQLEGGKSSNLPASPQIEAKMTVEAVSRTEAEAEANMRRRAAVLEMSSVKGTCLALQPGLRADSTSDCKSWSCRTYNRKDSILNCQASESYFDDTCGFFESS